MQASEVLVFLLYFYTIITAIVYFLAFYSNVDFDEMVESSIDDLTRGM